jgi:hypothetical protein
MIYLKFDGEGFGFVLDGLGIQVDTHISFVTLVVTALVIGGLRVRKVLRDKKRRIK